MIACLAFVASEAVTNTDIRKRLKYKRNEKMRLSENNAFSTSHQSVTVYGLPKKIYEARTEDTAVDVQIHRTTGQIAPVVQISNTVSKESKVVEPMILMMCRALLVAGSNQQYPFALRARNKNDLYKGTQS